MRVKDESGSGGGRARSREGRVSAVGVDEREGGQGELTSERVHVEAGDPLESRVERLDQLLLEQVVHPDLTLGLRERRQVGQLGSSRVDESRNKRTATKKCGREGWNDTRCTSPFCLVKGACV